jgi:YYY domain-containing protein
MQFILTWYLLATLLGWLTFPLAYHLFPALADRGYTLSRALGLLIWGYVFWLFASLGIAQNDAGGLLLGLAVLAGLSAWAAASYQASVTNSPILSFVKAKRSLLLTTEILFLAAFAFMCLVRTGNPEILGTEKPMELMMIHGIMNSPAFPPRDLWLSGYSISYYYFGYVMTSMLATLTGTPATAAFNLMIALVFALSAVGAYGILYNLLANYQLQITEDKPVSNLQSPIPPLLAPIFLLLVSNAEGFLEVLHQRGLFWRDGANFWTWLDIPELREAPAQAASWMPDRFWWWWRASRVVQDYELNGAFREVIDEFPAFSYVLGDLHPHVLAMPFVLLAIALALNLFRGGLRGTINLYFGHLHISRMGFLLIALTLGGLAFLNTWDVLTGVTVIVFGYALARVHESGWGWERIEDVLLLAIPSLIAGYVMYLPFFIGFDSQAGGVVPNFMFPTRGAQLWVMWGMLFIPIVAYVIRLVRVKTPANWRAGTMTTVILLITLLAAMFTIGFLALHIQPDLINGILESQGLDANAFVAESFVRRLTYIGSLVTLLALLIPALSFLFVQRTSQVQDGAEKYGDQSSSVFSFLLIALGILLILGPDFLYLRDNFGYRINTVFKFYYQAWILLSLAAAYGTAVLLRPFDFGSHSSFDPPLRTRGAPNIVFSVILALVLIVGLTYPALGFFTKTNSFKPPFGFSLDDFDRVQRENPDEAAAIVWLRSAPDGVVAEAVGGAYSSYARISIYTGLPTVLGWGNHEGQWRDQFLQGSRQQDIETLYATPDWLTAQEIIDRYDIRYVYVGDLEWTTYRVNEEKFNGFLKVVFQQGNVAIYEAP